MKGIPVTLVKANQLMLVLLTLTSILFQNIYIVMFTFGLIVLSLIFGPRANVAMQIAKWVIKDLKNDETEAVVLLRFNQIIASSLLFIAIITFLITQHWIAWVFVGMVTVAASIALAGFCIGCFLYYQYKRLLYKSSQS
ncbi:MULTISPECIES: DUF4395 domain-containing protein [Bacillaceae]|uniref:DUF4395 domain-containing protein n=1 Tax=Evansella alkalicola TaxID=745819 RepID=A0ABS6JU13_9BACI|nr:MULTISPECIES: DUF4395 domain-containing protein [Bacillaceae]MBU9722031.1 DUF4395 domain-containing protein [Bacillus alkalicola]